MIHNFLILKKLSFSNKAQLYLLLNLLSILLFAILYYGQDYFISNNIELSKELGILNKNYKEQSKINSFLYYVWFSLITQTTVGYGGIIDNHGQTVPFTQISYYPFKILNILQLFTIFGITSLFL